MVEVVFSYTFQNLHENLASEGLEHRSEDLMRCFRLGTDALRRHIFQGSVAVSLSNVSVNSTETQVKS